MWRRQVAASECAGAPPAVRTPQESDRGRAEAAATIPTVSDSDSAAVLDRFLAAWSRRDLEDLTDCLHPEIVYSGSDGSTVRGRPAVTALFAEQLDGDPDLTIAPIAVRGDRGFGYFSYPPATDGTTLRGVDVYTVRDGLIVAKDVLSKIA